MAYFRYRAIAANGSIVKGVLDAPSELAVIQQLRKDGHYPVSASLDKRNWLGEAFRGLFQFRARLPLSKLALATQELSVLMSAGLELDRALGILSSMQDIGPLAKAFVSVRNKIRDGSSLADALAGERKFPKFYIGMVRAGEMGSSIPATLKRLSDYLARSLVVRETILSALVYPAVLMVTAGLSIIFILTFVLPQFEPLFAEAGRELPLPTRIVMALSDGFRDFWWVILLAVLGAGIWLKKSLEKPIFRRHFDARLLGVPVLGKLLFDIEIERFCRMVGTMLENGVTLPMALGYSQDVLRNSEIAAGIKDAAIGLHEGESLAARLSKLKSFSKASLDLVQIGEETGRLDEMLIRQADLDEARIRKRLDRLLALLVPGLTILLGIVVAGLIASMLVAILSVNDLALQ